MATLAERPQPTPWLRGISFIGLLAVWQLASLATQVSTLPSPGQVAKTLGSVIASGELPYHLSVTLLRVAASFVIAMAIGAVLGLLMGRFRRFDAATDGILIIGLNTPALIVIILCYIWVGLTEVAAILAVVINKVPTVTVTVREGARAVDLRLLEVAEVYRLPRSRVLRQIYLPQLQPYLLAAARSGLSLIWKIVLVVELLGRSSGVGFKLATFFQYFDIASILAYTVAFVAVVFTVETLVMRPLDRRAARWHA